MPICGRTRKLPSGPSFFLCGSARFPERRIRRDVPPRAAGADAGHGGRSMLHSEASALQHEEVSERQGFNFHALFVSTFCILLLALFVCTFNICTFLFLLFNLFDVGIAGSI